jgi:subfamily B ATP-binding cassette protein MsbA
MHEGLTGARVVKAYNLEDIVVDDFQARQQHFYGRYMRMVRAGEIPGPLIEFFGSVGVALLLTKIAVSRAGGTTAGFIGFVGALQFIYTKIKVVVRIYNQMVQGQAASKRVFELLDTETDLPEPKHPKPLNAADASIEFENISFAYDGTQLFDKFNLTVRPGQLVALVGQSGSGKTTLTNLLLRFYDPQGGAVKIGGVDIRDINSKDLRAQIAVVTQETILFNETVRRNIELGRPGASLDEIKTAAKHAHAAEFIEKKEKEGGYDMVIGEKGNTLSGGQKQRLAIARAILKDAPILILDEATSALDTESERAVQAALDELMEGRTTICIAHRLSTVQHADVIVVMDQGRIVEKGTHKELLEQGGLYQKLYQMQFRES